MRLLNCFSSPRSTEISEKEIKIIANRFHEAIKILLLGTGESGKTTLLKQMKILHIQEYTDRERMEKAQIIKENMHDCIFEIVRNVPVLGLEFENETNVQKSNWLMELGKETPTNFSEEYVLNVKSLWQDQGVKCSFSRSNEYQLIDSAKYFLDRCEVICADNYLPNTEDILRSRKITTGIQEVRFNVKVPNRNYYQEIRMFDVGGQRDHRKKWILAFEGVEAVLFLISCCDFDQTIREDCLTNRLAEALSLFDRVWNNNFLLSAGLICFLNKQDLMEQKIKNGKSIGKFFPEYQDFMLSNVGDDVNECNRTRCFIINKLVQITSKIPKKIANPEVFKKECYFHYTIATDTNNIRNVFDDVHNMILNKYMEEIGLW